VHDARQLASFREPAAREKERAKEAVAWHRLSVVQFHSRRLFWVA